MLSDLLAHLVCHRDGLTSLLICSCRSKLHLVQLGLRLISLVLVCLDTLIEEAVCCAIVEHGHRALLVLDASADLQERKILGALATSARQLCSRSPL